jgi:hypothetical protein
MDGCDLSQTKILDAQRPGYSGNLGHQSVQINVCTVGAAQKPLELGLRADEIAVLTPLNERPTPQEQPFSSAGKFETVITAFAQLPDVFASSDQGFFQAALEGRSYHVCSQM